MDGHKPGYIFLIVAAILSYVATLVFNVLATGYGASIGTVCLEILTLSVIDLNIFHEFKCYN